VLRADDDFAIFKERHFGSISLRPGTAYPDRTHLTAYQIAPFALSRVPQLVGSPDRTNTPDSRV
jgi:hypothetical protein